jgi:hypothetical protein
LLLRSPPAVRQPQPPSSLELEDDVLALSVGNSDSGSASFGGAVDEVAI